MDSDFRNAVEQAGGHFIKTDFMPLGTTDFSSYMIAAKNAKPDVLALLNAGADTVNSMKAAKQFGLDKQMKIAVGLLFLSDVDALPQVFEGLADHDQLVLGPRRAVARVGRPVHQTRRRR